MKLAAVDIGSNAVRLLLSRVYDENDTPFFKKESLIRMPLRLGEDAFLRKKISRENIDRLVATMVGFRYLMKGYPAIDYMACATSAMREAENSKEILRQVYEASGIEIEIISGMREAEIIYANRIADLLDPNKNYLYIDVGGGSTELTLFSNGAPLQSQSFNIGTVRLLNNLVPDTSWDEMKKWVKINIRTLDNLTAIGSGGNINKLVKIANVKQGRFLQTKKLREIAKMLQSFSLEDRIRKLNMRADRADVIVPAAQIYLSTLKWGRIKDISVPSIGLADGIIHLLYEKHTTNFFNQANAY
ncbi:MAG: exopolyphosphatase [Calditrichaeota bacterium]|nr:MAG: exopolyphosphatase [Calditrichota bacterium]